MIELAKERRRPSARRFICDQDLETIRELERILQLVEDAAATLKNIHKETTNFRGTPSAEDLDDWEENVVAAVSLYNAAYQAYVLLMPRLGNLVVREIYLTYEKDIAQAQGLTPEPGDVVWKERTRQRMEEIASLLNRVIIGHLHRKLHIESVRVRALIDQAQQMLAEGTQEELQEVLTIDIPQEARVEVDPEIFGLAITQVFANETELFGIVTRVQVTTLQDESGTTLIIEDNGNGFSDEMRAKTIMLDRSNAFAFGYSSSGEGRGVGMSFLFQVVRDHNATIKISNESGLRQGGARISIYIPPTASSPVNNDGRKMRDDNVSSSPVGEDKDVRLVNHSDKLLTQSDKERIYEETTRILSGSGLEAALKENGIDKYVLYVVSGLAPARVAIRGHSDLDLALAIHASSKEEFKAVVDSLEKLKGLDFLVRSDTVGIKFCLVRFSITPKLEELGVADNIDLFVKLLEPIPGENATYDHFARTYHELSRPTAILLSHAFNQDESLKILRDNLSSFPFLDQAQKGGIAASDRLQDAMRSNIEEDEKTDSSHLRIFGISRDVWLTSRARETSSPASLSPKSLNDPFSVEHINNFSQLVTISIEGQSLRIKKNAIDRLIEIAQGGSEINCFFRIIEEAGYAYVYKRAVVYVINHFEGDKRRLFAEILERIPSEDNTKRELIERVIEYLTREEESTFFEDAQDAFIDFLEAVRKDSGAHVLKALDLGAGLGDFERLAKRHSWGRGVDFVPIDISESMISTALFFNFVEVQKMNWAPLDFKDETFDLVVFNFPNPHCGTGPIRLALRAARRVLRNAGGLAFFSTDSEDNGFAPSDIIRILREEGFQGQISIFSGTEIPRSYPEGSATAKIEPEKKYLLLVRKIGKRGQRPFSRFPVSIRKRALSPFSSPREYLEKIRGVKAFIIDELPQDIAARVSIVAVRVSSFGITQVLYLNKDFKTLGVKEYSRKGEILSLFMLHASSPIMKSEKRTSSFITYPGSGSSNSSETEAKDFHPEIVRTKIQNFLNQVINFKREVDVGDKEALARLGELKIRALFERVQKHLMNCNELAGQARQLLFPNARKDLRVRQILGEIPRWQDSLRGAEKDLTAIHTELRWWLPEALDEIIVSLQKLLEEAPNYSELMRSSEIQLSLNNLDVILKILKGISERKQISVETLEFEADSLRRRIGELTSEIRSLQALSIIKVSYEIRSLIIRFERVYERYLVFMNRRELMEKEAKIRASSPITKKPKAGKRQDLIKKVLAETEFVVEPDKAVRILRGIVDQAVFRKEVELPLFGHKDEVIEITEEFIGQVEAARDIFLVYEKKRQEFVIVRLPPEDGEDSSSSSPIQGSQIAINFIILGIMMFVVWVRVRLANRYHQKYAQDIDREKRLHSLVKHGWDWDNAREAPWKEAIRYPEVQRNGPESLNEHNYFANQQDMLGEFLYLIRDLAVSGSLDIFTFSERLREMNRILLTGPRGDRIYITFYMPYHDDQVNDPEAVQYVQSIAGQFGNRFGKSVKGQLRNLLNRFEAFASPDFQDATEDEVAYLIAEIYEIANDNNQYIFVHGNHSLFMNMANAMFRLHELKGIPHGRFDKDLIREKLDLKAYFLGQVRAVNGRSSTSTEFIPSGAEGLRTSSPAKELSIGKWYNRQVEFTLPEALVRHNHIVIEPQLESLLVNYPELEGKVSLGNILYFHIEEYVAALYFFCDVLKDVPVDSETLENHFVRFQEIANKRGSDQAGMLGYTLGHCTREDMRNLFQYILSPEAEEEISQDAVRFAAKIFIKTVGFQSLSDGNHRNADFLLNYILLKNHYTFFALTSENVERYYCLLNTPDLREGRFSLDEITEFFRQEVAKTTWLEITVHPAASSSPAHSSSPAKELSTFEYDRLFKVLLPSIKHLIAKGYYEDAFEYCIEARRLLKGTGTTYKDQSDFVEWVIRRREDLFEKELLRLLRQHDYTVRDVQDFGEWRVLLHEFNSRPVIAATYVGLKTIYFYTPYRSLPALAHEAVHARLGPRALWIARDFREMILGRDSKLNRVFMAISNSLYEVCGDRAIVKAELLPSIYTWALDSTFQYPQGRNQEERMWLGDRPAKMKIVRGKVLAFLRELPESPETTARLRRVYADLGLPTPILLRGRSSPSISLSSTRLRSLASRRTALGAGGGTPVGRRTSSPVRKSVTLSPYVFMKRRQLVELAPTNTMAADYLKAKPCDVDKEGEYIKTTPNLMHIFEDIIDAAESRAGQLRKLDLRSQIDELYKIIIEKFPRLLDEDGYCTFVSIVLIRALQKLGHKRMVLYETPTLSSVGIHNFIINKDSIDPSDYIYIDLRLQQFERLIGGVRELLSLSLPDTSGGNVSSPLALDRGREELVSCRGVFQYGTRRRGGKLGTSLELNTKLSLQRDTLPNKLKDVPKIGAKIGGASSPVKEEEKKLSAYERVGLLPAPQGEGVQKIIDSTTDWLFEELVAAATEVGGTQPPSARDKIREELAKFYLRIKDEWGRFGKLMPPLDVEWTIVRIREIIRLSTPNRKLGPFGESLDFELARHAVNELFSRRLLEEDLAPKELLQRLKSHFLNKSSGGKKDDSSSPIRSEGRRSTLVTAFRLLLAINSSLPTPTKARPTQEIESTGVDPKSRTKKTEPGSLKNQLAHRTFKPQRENRVKERVRLGVKKAISVPSSTKKEVPSQERKSVWRALLEESQRKERRYRRTKRARGSSSKNRDRSSSPVQQVIRILVIDVVDLRDSVYQINQRYGGENIELFDERNLGKQAAVDPNMVLKRFREVQPHILVMRRSKILDDPAVAQETFESVPMLGHVVRAGVGIEHIAQAQASRYGVRVINEPFGNNNAVAEWTLRMILAAQRRSDKIGGQHVTFPSDIFQIPLDQFEEVLRQRISLHAQRGEDALAKKLQRDSKHLLAPICEDQLSRLRLRDTIGFIGLGNIGTAVAKKLHRLDEHFWITLRMIAYDDNMQRADSMKADGLRKRAEEAGVELLGTAREVFLESDIVTIHIPGGKNNERVINRELLEGSLVETLINTSRGEVVDEQAILNYLAFDPTFRYMSDFIPANKKLIFHSRGLFSDHLAGHPRDAFQQIRRNVGLIVESIVRELLGLKTESDYPITIVNSPPLGGWRNVSSSSPVKNADNRVASNEHRGSRIEDQGSRINSSPSTALRTSGERPSTSLGTRPEFIEGRSRTTSSPVSDRSSMPLFFSTIAAVVTLGLVGVLVYFARQSLWLWPMTVLVSGLVALPTGLMLFLSGRRAERELRRSVEKVTWIERQLMEIHLKKKSWGMRLMIGGALVVSWSIWELWALLVAVPAFISLSGPQPLTLSSATKDRNTNSKESSSPVALMQSREELLSLTRQVILHMYKQPPFNEKEPERFKRGPRFTIDMFMKTYTGYMETVEGKTGETIHNSTVSKWLRWLVERGELGFLSGTARGRKQHAENYYWTTEKFTKALSAPKKEESDERSSDLAGAVAEKLRALRKRNRDANEERKKEGDKLLSLNVNIGLTQICRPAKIEKDKLGQQEFDLESVRKLLKENKVIFYLRHSADEEGMPDYQSSAFKSACTDLSRVYRGRRLNASIYATFEEIVVDSTRIIVGEDNVFETIQILELVLEATAVRPQEAQEEFLEGVLELIEQSKGDRKELETLLREKGYSSSPVSGQELVVLDRRTNRMVVLRYVRADQLIDEEREKMAESLQKMWPVPVLFTRDDILGMAKYLRTTKEVGELLNNFRFAISEERVEGIVKFRDSEIIKMEIHEDNWKDALIHARYRYVGSELFCAVIKEILINNKKDDIYLTLAFKEMKALLARLLKQEFVPLHLKRAMALRCIITQQKFTRQLIKRYGMDVFDVSSSPSTTLRTSPTQSGLAAAAIPHITTKRRHWVEFPPCCPTAELHFSQALREGLFRFYDSSDIESLYFANYSWSTRGKKLTLAKGYELVIAQKYYLHETIIVLKGVIEWQGALYSIKGLIETFNEEDRVAVLYRRYGDTYEEHDIHFKDLLSGIERLREEGANSSSSPAPAQASTSSSPIARGSKSQRQLYPEIDRSKLPSRYTEEILAPLLRFLQHSMRAYEKRYPWFKRRHGIVVLVERPDPAYGIMRRIDGNIQLNIYGWYTQEGWRSGFMDAAFLGLRAGISFVILERANESCKFEPKKVNLALLVKVHSYLAPYYRQSRTGELKRTRILEALDFPKDMADSLPIVRRVFGEKDFARIKLEERLAKYAFHFRGGYVAALTQLVKELSEDSDIRSLNRVIGNENISASEEIAFLLDADTTSQDVDRLLSEGIMGDEKVFDPAYELIVETFINDMLKIPAIFDWDVRVVSDILHKPLGGLFDHLIRIRDPMVYREQREALLEHLGQITEEVTKRLDTRIYDGRALMRLHTPFYALLKISEQAALDMIPAYVEEPGEVHPAWHKDRAENPSDVEEFVRVLKTDQHFPRDYGARQICALYKLQLGYETRPATHLAIREAFASLHKVLMSDPAGSRPAAWLAFLLSMVVGDDPEGEAVSLWQRKRLKARVLKLMETPDATVVVGAALAFTSLKIVDRPVLRTVARLYAQWPVRRQPVVKNVADGIMDSMVHQAILEQSQENLEMIFRSGHKIIRIEAKNALARLARELKVPRRAWNDRSFTEEMHDQLLRREIVLRFPRLEASVVRGWVFDGESATGTFMRLVKVSPREIYQIRKKAMRRLPFLLTHIQRRKSGGSSPLTTLPSTRLRSLWTSPAQASTSSSPVENKRLFDVPLSSLMFLKVASSVTSRNFKQRQETLRNLEMTSSPAQADQRLRERRGSRIEDLASSIEDRDRASKKSSSPALRSARPGRRSREEMENLDSLADSSSPALRLGRRSSSPALRSARPGRRSSSPSLPLRTSERNEIIPGIFDRSSSPIKKSQAAVALRPAELRLVKLLAAAIMRFMKETGGPLFIYTPDKPFGDANFSYSSSRLHSDPSKITLKRLRLILVLMQKWSSAMRLILPPSHVLVITSIRMCSRQKIRSPFRVIAVYKEPTTEIIYEGLQAFINEFGLRSFDTYEKSKRQHFRMHKPYSALRPLARAINQYLRQTKNPLVITIHGLQFKRPEITLSSEGVRMKTITQLSKIVTELSDLVRNVGITLPLGQRLIILHSGMWQQQHRQPSQEEANEEMGKGKRRAKSTEGKLLHEFTNGPNVDDILTGLRKFLNHQDGNQSSSPIKKPKVWSNAQRSQWISLHHYRSFIGKAIVEMIEAIHVAVHNLKSDFPDFLAGRVGEVDCALQELLDSLMLADGQVTADSIEQLMQSLNWLNPEEETNIQKIFEQQEIAGQSMRDTEFIQTETRIIAVAFSTLRVISLLWDKLIYKLHQPFTKAQIAEIKFSLVDWTMDIEYTLPDYVSLSGVPQQIPFNYCTTVEELGVELLLLKERQRVMMWLLAGTVAEGLRRLYFSDNVEQKRDVIRKFLRIENPDNEEEWTIEERRTEWLLLALAKKIGLIPGQIIVEDTNSNSGNSGSHGRDSSSSSPVVRFKDWWQWVGSATWSIRRKAISIVLIGILSSIIFAVRLIRTVLHEFLEASSLIIKRIQKEWPKVSFAITSFLINSLVYTIVAIQSLPHTLRTLGKHRIFIRERPVTFREEIERILKEVVFAGTEDNWQRPVFVYGGDVVHAIQLFLAKSKQFNLLKVAPVESITGDVAFAWAQQHGIAVVSATYSVGTKPILLELEKAIVEGLPVILIGGSHPPESVAGKSDWLHTGTRDNASIPDRDVDIRIAKALKIPVFDFSDSTRRKVLAKKFLKAVHTAIRKQTPVFIRIQPQVLDYLTYPVQDKARESVLAEKLSFWYKCKLSRRARKFIHHLALSRQPVLHIGEVIPHRLSGLLEEVSKRLGIFTTVSWGAKGLLREDIPTYLGPYVGAMSQENAGTKTYIEEADFVLRLANRKVPTYIGTGAASLKFPPDTMVVSASKKYPRGADIEFFLRKILEFADQENHERRKINSELTFAHQVLPDGFIPSLSDSIRWDTLHRTLGYFNLRKAKKAFTYLVDPSTAWFLAMFMITKGRGAIFSNWNYGQMGVSFGQVIAAALSTRFGDPIPIGLSGDGGWFMKGENSLHELLRLKDHGFVSHAIFIILEDRSLELGKPSVDVDLENRLYETHTPEMDLVSAYKAKGAKAYRVDNNGELIDALSQAENNPGIHIIIAKIDESAKPPKALTVYAEGASSRRRTKSASSPSTRPSALLRTSPAQSDQRLREGRVEDTQKQTPKPRIGIVQPIT
ncbi:NAD(P)-dependent oxidoreductase, partial [Candidatus Omnitrophota bacterium]